MDGQTSFQQMLEHGFQTYPECFATSSMVVHFPIQNLLSQKDGATVEPPELPKEVVETKSVDFKLGVHTEKSTKQWVAHLERKHIEGAKVSPDFNVELADITEPLTVDMNQLATSRPEFTDAQTQPNSLGEIWLCSESLHVPGNQRSELRESRNELCFQVMEKNATQGSSAELDKFKEDEEEPVIAKLQQMDDAIADMKKIKSEKVDEIESEIKTREEYAIEISEWCTKESARLAAQSAQYEQEHTMAEDDAIKWIEEAKKAVSNFFEAKSRGSQALLNQTDCAGKLLSVSEIEQSRLQATATQVNTLTANLQVATAECGVCTDFQACSVIVAGRIHEELEKRRKESEKQGKQRGLLVNDMWNSCNDSIKVEDPRLVKDITTFEKKIMRMEAEIEAKQNIPGSDVLELQEKVVNAREQLAYLLALHAKNRNWFQKFETFRLKHEDKITPGFLSGAEFSVSTPGGLTELKIQQIFKPDRSSGPVVGHFAKELAQERLKLADATWSQDQKVELRSQKPQLQLTCDHVCMEQWQQQCSMMTYSSSFGQGVLDTTWCVTQEVGGYDPRLQQAEKETEWYQAWRRSAGEDSSGGREVEAAQVRLPEKMGD